MAITRHGINRAETGALMRSSFEETVEILMEAAAVGENDDCRGVSENVMLGQTAPVGTGDFDILLDEGMMSELVVDHRMLGVGAEVIGGSATPYDDRSPMAYDTTYNMEDTGAAFSPLVQSGSETPGGFQDISAGFASPYAGIASPSYAPQSPFGGISSPGYSPASPSYSPSSCSPWPERGECSSRNSDRVDRR